MAVVMEWTPEQKRRWDAWMRTRPPAVRSLCKRFPPNRLYRLGDTGHRVTIYSYFEDGTLTVDVTGQFNALAFERRVFGIRPENLEECDLPAPSEKLGVVLTDDELMEALGEGGTADERHQRVQGAVVRKLRLVK